MFYCNLTCQKVDWKLHKPYCKPLESSDVATLSPQALRISRVSTSEVDVRLCELLSAFLATVRMAPKSVRKLPGVLKDMQALVARGARPDALIIGGDAGQRNYVSSLAVVVESATPRMQPLLESLLAASADLKPALDLDASCCAAIGERSAPCGDLFTPLALAIRRFRHSFVRLLVAHGADLRAPCARHDDGQMTWPVHACVSITCNHLKTDQLINGALETLDYLLSAGADPDACDHSCQQPALLQAMHFASEEQRPDRRAVMCSVAMRLIDAGAGVNARNTAQTRPLDAAADLPSLDIFRALIAKGADPSPTPFITKTAPGHAAAGEQMGIHYLQTAVQNGRADVLQAATAAGVNLKKVKTLGSYAKPLLAQAVCFHQLACVRFLLEYDVDVNEVFKVHVGKVTVCDIASDPAIGGVSRQILEALRSAGGKRYSEL